MSNIDDSTQWQDAVVEGADSDTAAAGDGQALPLEVRRTNATSQALSCRASTQRYGWYPRHQPVSMVRSSWLSVYTGRGPAATRTLRLLCLPCNVLLRSVLTKRPFDAETPERLAVILHRSSTGVCANNERSRYYTMWAARAKNPSEVWRCPQIFPPSAGLRCIEAVLRSNPTSASLA
jgi:hypothetical protein